MKAGPDAQSAAERARRIVDLSEALPRTEPAGEGARALGWALKDLCYASWSSEPQRAVKAATALRELRDAIAVAAGEPPERRVEVEALADWTAGIAHLIGGEMSDATRRFDAAAAAFAGLNQHHHAAQTQVPKIMALAMLGQNDEAAECAEAAQRAFVAHGDMQAASKVSLNLGSLQLRSDRYALAARHYREAAVLFARVADHEHSVMADIGLADALTALGDFGESLRMYARARMRAETHGFPVLKALVEESVALLHLARGHYRDALVGFESSRRRYEQLAMPQNLAIAEKQLADAYLELRLLPEALAVFDSALARFAALDMPVDQAWTLVQRGRALALLQQPEAADASLADAARLFAELHNATGGAAVALARAELALAGGDAAAAAAFARDAARGFEATGLAERRLRADAALAQALLEAGDVATASALFDATLASARALQLLPVQLRCLTGRGVAARAAGDRPAARAAFEAAIELFEDQRRALPGDEVRSAFLSDHLRPFHELLGMALELHEAGETPARAADVLEQLDRFRARTLADRLGRRDDAGSDAEDGATRDLRARLGWLYRRMQRLHEEGGVSATATADLRSTERELLERARRRRLTAHPQAPADAGNGLRAASRQPPLGPHDAIVAYGVLGDELFACVVTPDGVRVRRRLARWPQVRETVRSLRFQIETLRHGAAPVACHVATLALRTRTHLARLHAQVWAPLAETLSGLRRILIVPHAQLGSVPFAALHDDERCLVEEHQLSLAPSVRVALLGLVQRPALVREVVALGESSRLPHASGEARLVANLFARGAAFVGEQATIANLLRHASSADVLHFACHAQFRADNPLFSALYLHDGVLSAESIEALRLPPAIVVLSACETALHEEGGSDDMFGLARSFFVAGAARVVASLWPVDDASTADFMERFYAGLRGGQPPAAALRDAQLVIRERHEHPFYWASFALIGGW